jgi:hypothetical protein
MGPEFGIRSFTLLFEFISCVGLFYTFWTDIVWQAIIWTDLGKKGLGHMSLVGEKQYQNYHRLCMCNSITDRLFKKGKSSRMLI